MRGLGWRSLPTASGGGASRGTVRRLPPAGAAGPAEPEVEAAGVQRVDQAELLDRGQGGAVAHLDRTRSDPDRRGRGGGQGQYDGRRGAGDAGVEVVLGEPVPGVAEALGRLRQVDAVPQGLGGGRTRADRHQVENGEGVLAMAAPYAEAGSS